MVSPFVGFLVDLGARIVQGPVRRQGVFRDRSLGIASEYSLRDRGSHQKATLHKEAVHLLLRKKYSVPCYAQGWSDVVCT